MGGRLDYSTDRWPNDPLGRNGVVGPTNLSEMNRTMFKRGPITPPGVGPTTHAATLAHFSGQRVD
ncbi:hypothetical protein J6590_068646 [Homalodisca vitripennis]|nr:hypothetical protein J6590_068646 [Homalodisca vitripennis]